MKTLKLDHQLAVAVLAGHKASTWRLNDDKYLSVNDEVQLIDKVDPNDKQSWKIIGVAIIDSVVEKRFDALSEEDWIGHERYESDEAMYEAYRKYYGPEVGPATPLKIIKFSFKPHATPLSVDKIIPPRNVSLTTVKLFCDGGSRGNPGPSAAGFVLLGSDDEIIRKGGEYLGITTNNQAEYQSLKLGLEEAQKQSVYELAVHMDSMLVINQMKGVFKVKNRDLWPIHEAVKELIGHFKKVTFTHVPRELNKLADAEVNETLDAYANKSVV